MLELVLSVLALTVPPSPPEPEPAPAVNARALFAPRAHFFGQILEARIELAVDARRVDPDSVAVRPRFFPYERVGRREVTRTRRGAAVRIAYAYPVSCMAPICVRKSFDEQGQPQGTTTIALDPVRVSYRLANGKQASKAVRWGWNTLSTRLPPELLEFRSTFGGPLELMPLVAETRPPRETYRVTPLVATAALGGIALLALGGAVVLGAPLLPRRKPRFLEAPPKSPLEQALDTVAAVSANGAGGAEHREALERLAEELAGAGMREHTNRARRLAWSSEPPGREPSLALVRDVRASLEGG